MSGSEAQTLPESVVDEVVARNTIRTGDVLGVLEELQKRHPQNYLPKATLAQVSRKMGVALSQIYSVVTFYSFFNLVQQGKKTILVCRGTACHTRGAKALVDRMKALLHLEEIGDGESYRTPDGAVVVRTVACFGQCALAPAIAIGERVHGNVTDRQLEEILKREV